MFNYLLCYLLVVQSQKNNRVSECISPIKCEKINTFLFKRKKRNMIKCNLHGCPFRQKIGNNVCKGRRWKSVCHKNSFVCVINIFFWKSPSFFIIFWQLRSLRAWKMSWRVVWITNDPGPFGKFVQVAIITLWSLYIKVCPGDQVLPAATREVTI